MTVDTAAFNVSIDATWHDPSLDEAAIRWEPEQVGRPSPPAAGPEGGAGMTTVSRFGPPSALLEASPHSERTWTAPRPSSELSALSQKLP